MKKLRVYLDTSVIGGCFDTEFAGSSNGLIKDFRLGHFIPVLSGVVAAEIENAPVKVQEMYYELIDLGAEIIEVNKEVLILLEFFRKAKILNEKFEKDMTHIALAIVYKVDVLVSWNFKHIVHFDKIRQFNYIGAKAGYDPIAIYSPREVSNYE